MNNIPYFSAFDLAYYAVYRNNPPGGNKLINPPDVETTTFNGMVVETVLKQIWLESLCSIDKPNMRIISISGGRSRLYLAHVVFLLTNFNYSDAEKLIPKFDIYAGVMSAYSPHTDNAMFIGISTRNWYRYGTTQNSNWENWWDDICPIIEEVLLK